ncbi:MAG: hypothetical protein HUK25_02950 [Treponema sp.]|nr:hypothetical protein [Treponema sp.]
MRKSNFTQSIFHSVFHLLGFFCVFILFSCKSVPQGNFVIPLDLLDGENAFYLSVPSSADPELVSKIIQNNASITKKDADTAVTRIQKIYLGMTSNKKVYTYQAAVECNIPASFVPKLFSKKNGFSKSQYISYNTKKYDLYDSSKVKLSFPDSSTLVLGRNIENMLDTYTLYSNPSSDNILIGNPYIEDEFYDFLYSAKDSIRFYANKPQSFLSLLTGSNLDLKLSYVTGEMSTDPDSSTQYILDLEFEFAKERYVKTGKALLTLAFGLTNSQSEMISPTKLKISGIKLNKSQLYKMITF